MSIALIRKGFESRLKTWATAQSIAVAYENVAFTPPATKYLRAYLLPAPTDSETLDNLHRGYVGVFQVNIVMPLNVGSNEAQSLADSIAGLYPVSFAQDTIRVYITRPFSSRPAYQDGDRYVYPIYCNYRVDTN